MQVVRRATLLTPNSAAEEIVARQHRSGLHRR
jgi:hypothetical protein